MRVVAAFAMKGRMQAIMMACVFAMLSLIVPPLAIVSSAVVGLVTLRKGDLDGLLVAAGAAVACAVLTLVIRPESVAAVFGFVLLLWLPLWIIGKILRSTRAFSLALTVALGFGALLIFGIHAVLPDPVSVWQTALASVSDEFVNSGLIAAENKDLFVARAARWITGTLAAGYFLQVAFSLVLARWWQAYLYNPGGFGKEFRAFRAPRLIVYLALPVLAGLLFGYQGLGGLVWDIGVLLVGFFMIQGLAAVHGLVAAMGANVGWLVALYILFFIALPHVVIALSSVGYVDAWLDFRRRIGKRQADG